MARPPLLLVLVLAGCGPPSAEIAAWEEARRARYPRASGDRYEADRCELRARQLDPTLVVAPEPTPAPARHQIAWGRCWVHEPYRPVSPTSRRGGLNLGGCRTTMNDPETPLLVVLRRLAGETGLRFVIDPRVDLTGRTVSMRLKDIFYGDALKLLAEQQGLDARDVGDTIYLSPASPDDEPGWE